MKWFEEQTKKIRKEKMDYSVFKLSENDIDIKFQEDTMLEIDYNGSTVKFYPYTGWFTGKSVVDGRGLNNLIKQLKK